VLLEWVGSVADQEVDVLRNLRVLLQVEEEEGWWALGSLT